MKHGISLSDLYNQGDEVFVRLRLSSDPRLEGWGWAIDDFEISLASITAVIDIKATEIKDYPNPTHEYLNIEVDKSYHFTFVELHNINGQLFER